MASLVNVILIILAFWFILIFIASQFNLERINLSVSPGLLIWQPQWLKKFIQGGDNKIFKKIRQIGGYIGLALFYTVPIFLLANFSLKFVDQASPIFEANPVFVFHIDTFLMAIPAIFIVVSMYNLVKNKAYVSEGGEMDNSGFIGIAMIFFYFGILDPKKGNGRYLRSIGTAVLSLLLFSSIVYPTYLFLPTILSIGFDDPKGALVVNRFAGSPATEINIERGDIITTIKRIDAGFVVESISIESETDFYAALRSIDPNSEVLITINNEQFSVILEESPSQTGISTSYLGVQVEDYRPSKISFLSPLIPHLVKIFLLWIINLNLLFGLYALLPVPKSDGNKILLSLVKLEEDANSKTIIQGFALTLLFANMFIII